MKKKPIAVISTDWHLSPKNIEKIEDLIHQQCDLADKLGVDIMFCTGDVFDSRPGQKEETLTGLDSILSIFKDRNKKLYLIPGNHDKQNYKSQSSYLTPYRHHPNIHLFTGQGGLPIEKIFFHFLPYYEESKYYEELKELTDYIGTDKDFKRVLLSHTALNGSVNNDGSKVECGIAVNDFKVFDLVLLGHYHNQQQVGHNIFHIPSICQNNFGEDEKKGFTVLYDDLTFELVKSNFKQYKKEVIDLNKLSRKDIDKLAEKHSGQDYFIRFEIRGDKSTVKSFPKEIYESMGIDIKFKYDEIERRIDQELEIIPEYTSESIIEEFVGFCEEKGKDYDKGITYLLKKLNQ